MNAIVKFSGKSAVATFAGRFGMDQGEVMNTLKATAFKSKEPISDEQMTALLIIANQYGLNPFTKEIYAYPDKGAIVPVVGVDGWARIMNDHPQMNGIEFRYSEETMTHKGKSVHAWVEAVITRKDRTNPIVVREYFDEVCRNVGFATPWDSHPKRMHRHKALIQAARVAFGFSGIYDEDEAERIYEKDATPAPAYKETPARYEAKPVAPVPPPPPPQPEAYPNDRFISMAPKWFDAIDGGKKNEDEILSSLKAKNVKLTEPQLAVFRRAEGGPTLDDFIVSHENGEL